LPLKQVKEDKEKRDFLTKEGKAADEQINIK